MTYYPPENGRGEITFEKWYVDDRSGMMHPRSCIIRDVYGRLVHALQADSPDRDDLIVGYPIRTETEDRAYHE